MKSIQMLIVGLLVALFLVGCGGGSSGDSSAAGSASPNVAANAVPSVFSTATFFADRINNGYAIGGFITGSMTLNGTVQNISGTAYIQKPRPSTGTFEGQAAFVSNLNYSGLYGYMDANNNQVNIPLYHQFVDYFSTNYEPLGYSTAYGLSHTSEYVVIQGNITIPSAVKVGDSGIIANYIQYLDSTKTKQTGTITKSFVVEASPTTNTEVIFNLIDKTYDANKALVRTSEQRWAIDTLSHGFFISLTDTEIITSGSFAGGTLKYVVR